MKIMNKHVKYKGVLKACKYLQTCAVAQADSLFTLTASLLILFDLLFYISPKFDQ